MIDIPLEEPPSLRSQRYVEKWCYFAIVFLSLIAFLNWAVDCAEVKYTKNGGRTISKSPEFSTPEDIQGIVSIGIINKCIGTGDTITALLSVTSAFISTTLLILWNVSQHTAGAWCSRASNMLFVILIAAAILGTESHSGTEVWLGIAAFPAFLLAISSWKNIGTSGRDFTVPSPLIRTYPDSNTDAIAMMNAPELQPLAYDGIH